MSHFQVNERDIYFILKEQLNYSELCKLAKYRDLDVETLDLLVAEAIKFADGVVAPLQEIGDWQDITLTDNVVHCASGFREAFSLYGQNGWIAATSDPEYGGQGFPRIMGVVVNDLMYGACISFQMAPSLTHGAGRLLESFGTKELKERFIPSMFSADGQEPCASRNLRQALTWLPLEQRRFLKETITGSKERKSLLPGGDHDLTENIIHLALARMQGAPEGVKGISLFIVPKRRCTDQGIPERTSSVLYRARRPCPAWEIRRVSGRGDGKVARHGRHDKENPGIGSPAVGLENVCGSSLLC